MKKLGFDVDGVLASFSEAYQSLLIQQTGKDLFPPGPPQSWDWDLTAGYTKEERKVAFAWIAESRSFNVGLGPIEPNVFQLRQMLRTLELSGDVYFITNRMGETAKKQTEEWLRRWVLPPGMLRTPTTLIVKHGVKGIVCKALQLDAYIDDNYDNCVDCWRQSPATRTYLLDKSYNQRPDPMTDAYASVERVIEDHRVSSIHEFFLRESIITESTPV